MRYFPKRARRNLDISLLLKVCPICLGDLEKEVDPTGTSYRCMQCDEIVQPRVRGPLALPVISTMPGDFFPEAEATLT
jgi:hypothetical protein